MLKVVKQGKEYQMGPAFKGAASGRRAQPRLPNGKATFHGNHLAR